MIQRVQSVYLLIAAVLTAVTFFLPVLSFSAEMGNFQLSFEGLWQLQGDDFVIVERTWLLTVFMAIIPLLALITIFLFRNRKLQIRLCAFNMVLMLGFYAMVWVNGFLIENRFGASMTFEYTTAFPLVSAIFTYLALRAIGKDEALVHAADRLRPTKL